MAIGKKSGGGSRKGKPNATTMQAKEMINAAIDGQLIYFNTTMDEIRTDNPVDWAKILVSMFKFVMPVKTDITGEVKMSTIRIIRDGE
jgi:hypothetical protein